MPVLDDPRHEAFCRFVAQGKSKRDAAIAAGYPANRSSDRGYKLAKKDEIKRRIGELQEQVAEKTVEAAVKSAILDIADKQKRIAELDELRRRLWLIIEERANDPKLANIPGGKGGLVAMQFKAVGSGTNQKIVIEYSADTALAREIRAVAEQAATELGQWKIPEEPEKAVEPMKNLRGLATAYYRKKNGDPEAV